MSVPDPVPSANGPYSANAPYNQRIPDLQLPCGYPYIQFTQHRDGSWERQCVESGFESRSHGHVNGSFEELDYLGSHKSLHIGVLHTYTMGGKTTSVEGNHDEKIGGGTVAYTGGDSHSEQGGGQTKGVHGDVITATGGSTEHYPVGNYTLAPAGDSVHDTNDGSEHKNILGDHIRFTGGVKYDSVGSEHGLFVPNGNSDTNVGKNLNLQSGQQITIKVGSSIITVLGNSITITDSNNNQIGMTSSKMWAKPIDDNHMLYLGGPGNNSSLYSAIATTSGPAINVMAKYQQGQE